MKQSVNIPAVSTQSPDLNRFSSSGSQKKMHFATNSCFCKCSGLQTWTRGLVQIMESAIQSLQPCYEESIFSLDVNTDSGIWAIHPIWVNMKKKINTLSQLNGYSEVSQVQKRNMRRQKLRLMVQWFFKRTIKLKLA